MCGAAGRGRWPVVRPSGIPCGRRAPDGAPGQTPPAAAGTRCGRDVAAATRAARPVGHTSGFTYHAQGGQECVRGVVSPHGTPSAVPGGGTSGGPQRAWRAAAGGWCGRGVWASGCPRTAGHGRGRASPGLVGGLRVFHPGRGRRVADRPGGPVGSAGVRLRQGAVPSGPHRPGAQAVPAPWPLDASRACGVPCRTDGGQEVVQAAVVVVACADQPAPWRGHPAGACGTRRPCPRGPGTTWASCRGVGHTALRFRAGAQA